MPKRKVKKADIGFLKWILAIVGVVIVGFFVLKIVNFYIPKDGLVKPPSDLNQKEYVNEENGYSISYPKDWTFNKSAGVPADIIKNTDDTANIAIQRLVGDPRLLTQAGVTAIMKEMKDSYYLDKNYTVSSLEGTIWKGLPVLFTTGTFTDSGKLWNFEEYSIFFGSEIYNLRANWQNEKDAGAVKSVVSTFRLSGYDSGDSENANKALETVVALSEVKNFQKDVFENNQSKFSISVDSSPTKEDPYYTVIVGEFFPDHRTTFNRYRVDTENNVFRYDVVSDKWDSI